MILTAANNLFFRKYDENAFLNKLFTNGAFNCLTGTTFYAIVLQRLNIPFIIKEAPTHVYILAYPATFSIPVESTDPAMTINYPNEKDKQEFVKFLLDSKIITPDELNKKGQEIIFNENYYSRTEIKPIELAGLSYFNSGLIHLIEEKALLSFQQFEKAYLLYPSVKNRLLLSATMEEALQSIDLNNLNNMDYLLKYTSYSADKSNQNYYWGKIYSLGENLLIRSNNRVKFETLYQMFIQGLQDSTQINKAWFDYHYQLARAEQLQGRTDRRWDQLIQCYRIGSVDLNIKGQAIDTYLTKLSESAQSQEDSIFNCIDCDLTTYPFLAQSFKLLQFATANILYKGSTYFVNNNQDEGEKYLEKAEDLSIKYHFKLTDNYIGAAYGEAIAYYFRQKNYLKCRFYLDKGLKLSPNNPTLLRKGSYLPK